MALTGVEVNLKVFCDQLAREPIDAFRPRVVVWRALRRSPSSGRLRERGVWHDGGCVIDYSFDKKGGTPSSYTPTVAIQKYG